jgi:hypothetical protein
MFQAKVVEEIKTHFLSSKFFGKSYRLYDNEVKLCRAGQATDDNTMRRMRFACWIVKTTYPQAEHTIIISFPLHSSGYKNASQCYVHMYLAGLVHLHCTRGLRFKLHMYICMYVCMYVFFIILSMLHYTCNTACCSFIIL